MPTEIEARLFAAFKNDLDLAMLAVNKADMENPLSADSIEAGRLLAIASLKNDELLKSDFYGAQSKEESIDELRLNFSGAYQRLSRIKMDQTEYAMKVNAFSEAVKRAALPPFNQALVDAAMNVYPPQVELLNSDNTHVIVDVLTESLLAIEAHKAANIISLATQNKADLETSQQAINVAASGKSSLLSATPDASPLGTLSQAIQAIADRLQSAYTDETHKCSITANEQGGFSFEVHSDDKRLLFGNVKEDGSGAVTASSDYWDEANAAVNFANHLANELGWDVIDLSDNDTLLPKAQRALVIAALKAMDKDIVIKVGGTALGPLVSLDDERDENEREADDDDETEEVMDVKKSPLGLISDKEETFASERVLEEPSKRITGLELNSAEEKSKFIDAFKTKMIDKLASNLSEIHSNAGAFGATGPTHKLSETMILASFLRAVKPVLKDMTKDDSAILPTHQLSQDDIEEVKKAVAESFAKTPIDYCATSIMKVNAGHVSQALNTLIKTMLEPLHQAEPSSISEAAY